MRGLCNMVVGGIVCMVVVMRVQMQTGWLFHEACFKKRGVCGDNAT
jgi:hypothetical protein